MRAINLSNANSRNAQVGMDVRAVKGKVKMFCEGGSPIVNRRLLKFTPATSIESLTNNYGDDLTEDIINNDIEIDAERTGLILKFTKKIFLDPDLKVAHRITRKQVFYTPDGVEKEVRPFRTTESNINIDKPLRWTGKMIPKDKAVRMFAFTRKYQIRHINGLTFDFLQGIARELHEKNVMMLVGAGSKGIGPLVMSTGGTPYRAFLEGRMNGEKYCLIMHLTNLELKTI